MYHFLSILICACRTPANFTMKSCEDSALLCPTLPSIQKCVVSLGYILSLIYAKVKPHYNMLIT